VTPQGKLGIVVTTQPEGPVVYSIKNESPLQGLIFVDDLIVAIDGEDTRGWTAQRFVTIVAKKNGAPCKLTVLRPVDNNKE
jgi:C-terminal processing protease CtpA/Prc